MSKKKIAPCGAWPSPFSSDLLATRALGLSEPKIFDGGVYWLERRPDEGGRTTVLCKESGKPSREIFSEAYDACSRVHEYGGGSYCVSEVGVFFVNHKDQNIYLSKDGADPVAVTQVEHQRFADLHYDERRSRLVAVCENHGQDDKEAENYLVSIPVGGSAEPHPTVLKSGNNFYSSPCINKQGSHITWLEWSHPDMPWNKTELWLAELDDKGCIKEPRCISQDLNASVFQPRWSPEGHLYFVSDHSGWWNLYCYEKDNLTALLPMEAEFGLPQWVFGMSTYAFVSSQFVACSFVQDGRWNLGLLNLLDRSFKRLTTGYSDIGYVDASDKQIVFLGAAPDRPSAIVSYDLETGQCQELQSSMEDLPIREDISVPDHVRYSTAAGAYAYGYFYRPQNAGYTHDPNEKPPLIVRSHGGPTAATGSGFNPKIQYWTSRGFAVLDVNYRGSTGYGRAYRLSLNEAWGLKDVEDCVAGASYLSKHGEIDSKRLIITGSSAGGYTTLCALTFTDIFKAGASYYGIGDLEALARDTHKFESHYLEQLVGRYPDEADKYKERSPIHHVDQLSCPVIFFQGAKDKVVPPEQAQAMVSALENKNMPVAYVLFANERHGFRQAQAIRDSIDYEHAFYCRVFGIQPTELLKQLEISNAEKL